jgi:hypothetical protein
MLLCSPHPKDRSQTVVKMLCGRESAIRGSWKRLRQGDNLATFAETLPSRTRRSVSAWEDLGGFEAALTEQSDARFGSQHGNRWTMEGTLKMAFGQVGGGSAQYKRESHDEIAAVSMVALAHDSYIRQHMRSVFLTTDAAIPELRPSWFIVDRHWDLTPLNANFGICSDLVRPMAKYWLLEEDPTVDRGRRGKKKRI